MKSCHVLFQVLLSPSPGRQRGLYDQLKSFLKPAHLFERDIVIMPIKMPGHWALVLICSPLSVVKLLLQPCSPHRDDAAARTSLSAQAVQQLQPGILYMDSLGSKGSGCWWRAAVAQALLETYAAEQSEQNPACANVAQWPRLHQVPGPELSTPRQINMWTCGDFVLHYVRRFIGDIARPALDSDGKERQVELEQIITPMWFKSDEVKLERQSLVQYIQSESLQKEELTATAQNAGAGSADSNGSELDVVCDEISTAKENRKYMTELEAKIMCKMASFPVGPTTTTVFEDTTSGAMQEKVIVIFHFITYLSELLCVRLYMGM
jgi:hypothetical protein